MSAPAGQPTVTQTGTPTGKDPEPRGPQQLRREITVARATELARAGRYDQAERLLDDEGTAGTSGEAELDLRARIHAQRGELAEAEDLWSRAAAAAHGAGRSDAYRRERARVAALRRRRVRTFPLLRVLGAAVVALLLAALVALALVALLRPSRDGDLAAVQGRQDEISRQLDDLRSRAQAPPSSGPELPADLTGGLAAAGFDVRPRLSGVQVTFPTAPFGPNATEPTPAGSAALADLGRRLVPVVGRVTVRVDGYTAGAGDAAVPDAGGATLGFLRALAAARAVSAASGIPLAGIDIAGAGPGRAPFPDTERSRTVVVTIEPVG